MPAIKCNPDARESDKRKVKEEQMKMTVRQIVTATIIMLATVAISSIGLAVFFSTHLHRISTEVTDSLISVHAAGELQKYLRAYSLQNFIFDASHGTRYRKRRFDSEKSIRSWLEKVNEQIEGPGEASLVDKITKDVDSFIIEEQLTAGAGQSPIANFMSDSAKMKIIEENLERLVEVKLTSAEKIQTGMAVQAEYIKNIALVAGSLVLLACIGLSVWLSRYFYLPIVHLREAIKKFGDGHREIRACGMDRFPAEIAELSHRFNEMASALEQQRNSQLRFIAAVAHDLRNPLNGIRMASALLREQGQAQVEQHSYLEIIEQQAINLDHIVGDLLDTTRIEAGQLALHMENEDLVTLMQETICLYQTTTQNHTLMLSHPDGPLYAHCDRLRIGQVFNNLVSNAVKYSPYGGIINIAVQQEETEGLIVVRDEGMGIAVEDLESIFEPFHRSTSTRDTVPGIGLGLSVARRIIAAHQGRIQVESKVGEGATFMIWLPILEAKSTHVKSAVISQRDFPRATEIDMAE